jgi:hypothetical protein
VAVISFALQIDSEVYPELHALLSAISNEGCRGERLRQLAASGLVWEAIRIRGLPASLPHVPAAAPLAHAPAAHAPPTHAPAPFHATAGAGPKITIEAASLAPAGRIAVPAAPALDFIDLALDAPADRGRPAAQPPVLFDVVEPGHIKTPWASAAPVAAPAEPPALPPPPEVVERPEPSTSRSRLMRMKDKGLFRNG